MLKCAVAHASRSRIRRHQNSRLVVDCRLLRFYGLHKDLAENGLYIHSGVKEKGRFVAIPFAVQGKEATIFVNKEMLQMNKHFKGRN